MTEAAGVQQDAYLGQMDPTVPTHPYNAIDFAVRQILNGTWTVTLGQVKKVTGGGIEGPPTVSVQPLVNQIDGRGNPTPHGIINNLPAYRLQGGTGGIVADPIVGDIGIVAFASRDISAVIANKAASNPGSLRTFDAADGIFLGAVLGSGLEQYLRFKSDGVELVDLNGNVLNLSASGFEMTPSGGVFKVNGSIHATGGIIAGFGTGDSVNVQTHTHTQPPDSHGDIEAPTNAPTAGT